MKSLYNVINFNLNFKVHVTMSPSISDTEYHILSRVVISKNLSKQLNDLARSIKSEEFIL